MRICKYCNKPIAEKDIWNPDNDGNGYHYECLIDMEFKARDRQIYDKGKMDVLDKIKDEIEKTTSRYTISRERGAMGQVEWSDRLIKESEVLEIIDKYKAERSGTDDV